MLPDLDGVPAEKLARELLLRILPSEDVIDGPGMKDTPARMVKALTEMTAGYGVNLDSLMTTFPNEGYDQMILVKDIPFTSLCEHHLLPFVGVAHVAYIPTDRIVGLSKIPRVVDAYATQFQVQERLTKQIAQELTNRLNPRGVAVLIDSHHSCMSCRGVRKAQTKMVTSEVTGCFRDEPETRAEFFSLVKG